MSEAKEPQKGAREINTGGGANISGSVHVSGGDFVGRDKKVYGDVVYGSKIGGDVQTGGIRARHIEADNVVDGVLMQGGDAATAASLVELARAIQRGGIDAETIKAGKLVSGLHYIADPTTATTEDLRREVAALRAQLDQAIAAGEIPDPADAEDAQEALSRAETELAAPQPPGNRILRRLRDATEILTRSAEAAEAAEKVGARVIKLAPLAAVVLQVAQRLLGGG